MKTAPKNKQKAPKNYQLIVFALKIAQNASVRVRELS